MSKLELMKWEDYKVAFEFDGSFRDIYVLNTSSEDWQRLIDFAHSGVYKISYTIDGVEVALPQQVTKIFRGRYEANHVLCIQAGPVLIGCHFFDEMEIEFNIDPREIQNEAQAEAFFGFMRQIGNLLRKEVILTHEGGQSEVIFKFLPGSGEIQYTPCAPY